MLVTEVKEQEDGRLKLEVELSSEELDLIINAAIVKAIEDYISDSTD